MSCTFLGTSLCGTHFSSWHASQNLKLYDMSIHKFRNRDKNFNITVNEVNFHWTKSFRSVRWWSFDTIPQLIHQMTGETFFLMRQKICLSERGLRMEVFWFHEEQNFFRPNLEENLNKNFKRLKSKSHHNYSRFFWEIKTDGALAE